MKQSIQLRLGQHLTMTPQLQQAIRLLQLSTLELQTEIQEALDSNLMLELADGPGDDEHESPVSLEKNGQSALETGTPTVSEERPTESDIDREVESNRQEIPEDLPVDTAWDDIYDAGPGYTAGSGSDDDRDFLFRNTAPDTNIRNHLEWQLELSHIEGTDLPIAMAIVDAIDEDGYLRASLEEIRDSLLNGDAPLPLEEVEAVLHQIQNFDPPGVGARDLSECLAIQLRQLPAATPLRNKAIELVRDSIELLAGNNEKALLRKLRINSDELRDIVCLIRTLNPRPGSAIASGQTEYVIPDIVVTKTEGVWRVELNPEAAPKVRINSGYAGLIRRADSSSDNTTLKNHLQEARWFIKSLQSRHETLLKVATSIVERQREFFEYGEEAMKPMVLRDIAEAVEMHESTISRVTTQKYMHTPRGIFEFKYFFSSHVGTSDGGECSATAIRALIKKLVAGENTAKPLSDSRIATILKNQGIEVARRTVAKYREAMSIPPSNERRRLT